MTVHFHRVQSLAAFLEVLQSIAEDARLYANWPILHIEAHGDFTGIDVTSGEYLPWSKFEDELIAINASSRLNLLVMIAACKGANLLKVMASQVGRLGGRAPMRVLIGPTRNVTANEIEQACPAFYQSLFNTGDVAAARRAMNATIANDPLTFREYTAENIFHRLMHGYFRTRCSHDALAKRENTIVAQLEQMGMSGGQMVRRVLFESLRPTFEYSKEQFFFCDLYPENAARFRVTFEDCQGDPSETTDEEC